jgi:hypothetical protein
VTDTDRVFEAMAAAAVDGEVALPARQIAEATGLDEQAVRQAQHVLCQQRRLVFTGRRYGRTAIFQLIHSTPRGRGGQAGRSPEETPKGDLSGSSDSDLNATSTAQADTESVAPLDDAEALVVARVHRWVERVGIHCDRPEEVEDFVFGERGLVWKLTQGDARQRLRASLLTDDGFKARTVALWRGNRHVGERLEREQIERLARRPAEAATVAPASPTRGPAELLRSMPEPAPPAELLERLLTDEATASTNGGSGLPGRNGSRPADPDWPDLDWPDFDLDQPDY